MATCTVPLFALRACAYQISSIFEIISYSARSIVLVYIHIHTAQLAVQFFVQRCKQDSILLNLSLLKNPGIQHSFMIGIETKNLLLLLPPFKKKKKQLDQTLESLRIRKGSLARLFFRRLQAQMMLHMRKVVSIPRFKNEMNSYSPQAGLESSCS